jgi:hypothetical protein
MLQDCNSDFLHHLLWSFLKYNDLKREMVVPFVDIGGIVDNDCLNFLFLILIFLITSHIFRCFIIYNFGIKERVENS